MSPLSPESHCSSWQDLLIPLLSDLWALEGKTPCLDTTPHVLRNLGTSRLSLPSQTMVEPSIPLSLCYKNALQVAVAPYGADGSHAAERGCSCLPHCGTLVVLLVSAGPSVAGLILSVCVFYFLFLPQRCLLFSLIGFQYPIVFSKHSPGFSPAL